MIKKISTVLHTTLFLPRGNYELKKQDFFLSCCNILFSASKILKSTVDLYKLSSDIIFSFSVDNSYMCDVEERKGIILMTSQIKDICISLCVVCI